jgi:two-component system, OmpR family, response regulator
MHILLAEDDSVLADGLLRSLRASGYAVDHVDNGSDADSALATKSFDLLILDLGLPKMTGLDVLKRMRSKKNSTPVLILTAADSVEQRVRGLDLGADDYMPKPFALTELEARIRALVRRKMGTTSSQIQHGHLFFDQVSRTAFFQDVALDLSAREVGILEILLQRSGRLVSKEQMVEHLYEWESEVSHNAIEVYVHRLRKKVEPAGLKIATVRGLGYSLQKADE